jgi:hypothetical protein
LSPEPAARSDFGWSPRSRPNRLPCSAAWAQVSYGFVGHSPTIIGRLMGIEVFRNHGIGQGARRLRCELSKELVAQIVDGDSGAITICRAKVLGTSSIKANDVFVASLQPLKRGSTHLLLRPTEDATWNSLILPLYCLYYPLSCWWQAFLPCRCGSANWSVCLNVSGPGTKC